jgi:type II secretory pathway pseudopilin PulG
MTTDRTRRTTAVRPGFTLAEATLAMVLLGIAAAGVLLPFSGGAAAQAEGARRTLGAVLANDLIERIAGTPFDLIVETYDGWDEAEGQTQGTGDSQYAHFSARRRVRGTRPRTSSFWPL